MVTRRTRYRPHAIRGPALSRLCIRGLLRACCRTAARDACGSASLCRLSWQVMAAETVVSTGRGATQSGPVLCRGTAWHCCSSPHCRVGPARWPRSLCARSKGQAALCVRQRPMQQSVQGSRGCRGRVGAERRRDSSCSCCRGDQETALVLASATQMATAPRAVQHRGTGQPASLRRSRTQRGTAAVHIAVFLAVLPWSRRCVPTRSCSRWQNCPCDALDSPAPCCLEGPEKACRGALETQAHSTVHGRHSTAH